MSVPCWPSRLSRLSGFPRQIGPDRSPAAPHPLAPLGARVRAPVGWRILDAPGVPLPLPARGGGAGVRGIAGVTRWSLRLFLELMRRVTTVIAKTDSRVACHERRFACANRPGACRAP